MHSQSCFKVKWIETGTWDALCSLLPGLGDVYNKREMNNLLTTALIVVRRMCYLLTECVTFMSTGGFEIQYLSGLEKLSCLINDALKEQRCF